MTPPTYRVGVTRSFNARHFLIGGDFGPENELHGHEYRLEIVVTGSELDQHGYLLDIEHLNSVIDDILGRFADVVLNELPEFKGLNPSLEHFARILAGEIVQQTADGRLSDLTVRLWEDESAWAEHSLGLK